MGTISTSIHAQKRKKRGARRKRSGKGRGGPILFFQRTMEKAGAVSDLKQAGSRFPSSAEERSKEEAGNEEKKTLRIHVPESGDGRGKRKIFGEQKVGIFEEAREREA